MSLALNFAQQLRAQEALHAQQLVVHDDLQALSAAVAQRIAASASAAITARGAFHLALAGGETPRHCYQKLRGLEIDWAHVQIYLGDERCLPQGDPQRNDSMAQQALLDFIDIPQGNIHHIPAELGAHQAALGYAALLEDSPRLDLVLLGMGEDGHTASLFPDNPATESLEPVVPVYDAPKPPAERVTLGLATLNAARQKIFLVAGAGKRDALEQICRGKALPAARIPGAEWHLDRAACPGF
ncbi:MAG: 6-phosphogluconolactonase [Nitrosomonadales bacterium]|nr:6-phosphogluconolactonase [Nitrosomonadales bacterium]